MGLNFSLAEVSIIDNPLSPQNLTVPPRGTEATAAHALTKPAATGDGHWSWC